jgi:undecaprenyl-diphosphatase
MASGLEPEQAARFSFLMSIPVIAGAGLLEGRDALAQGLPDGVLLPLLIAMAVAVVVAILSLRLLFVFVRRVRLDVFGYYTIALGCAALFVIALC